MGKKRKGLGEPFGKGTKTTAGEHDSSRLLLNTYEDVANSEDEFLAHRDKILLHEGPESKKLKCLEEKGAETYYIIVQRANNVRRVPQSV